MALKTSNKNRKKIQEPIIPTAHEDLMDSINDLASMNSDINKANVTWTTIGVVVGIIILILII